MRGDQTAAARPEAAPLSLSMTQAGRQSLGADWHRVRAQDWHSRCRATWRVRHDLLEETARVAGSRCLGPAHGSPAGPSAACGQDRQPQSGRFAVGAGGARRGKDRPQSRRSGQARLKSSCADRRAGHSFGGQGDGGQPERHHPAQALGQERPAGARSARSTPASPQGPAR